MNKKIPALALLATLGVGATLALTSTPADAQAVPNVAWTTTKYAVKPSTIVVARGDGNWQVSDLKWSYWGTDEAKATGIEHKNNCKPACYDGTWSATNVNVLLDNVKSGHFTSVTVIYSQATVNNLK